MKTTDNIRRVDDFGRIAIPKHIRRNMQIQEGAAFEITQDADRIVLRPYALPRHEETIPISLSLFSRVNDLLAVRFISNMTEDKLQTLNAGPITHETIYHIVFDDHSSIDFSLDSDEESYWETLKWTSPNGDYSFFLEPHNRLGNIEVEIHRQIYAVKLAIWTDR